LKVTVAPRARDYVRREASYLKSRSPRAAQQFLDDLKRLRQELTRFPEMGKFNADIPVPGILRFVMGEYLVDYQVLKDETSIFTIRHGREGPPRLELEEDFDFEHPDAPDLRAK
jgi:plasmid stabilization system protein ParE